MLSEKQVQLIVAEANASVNVPFMSEGSEGEVIEQLVSRLTPHLEPALRAILPQTYVDCLKIALTEGIASDVRRQQISEKLIGELGEPLTRELNGRMDSSVLPEAVEASVLEQVTKKMIKEFVEWTIGELDEKMNSLG